MYADKLQNWNLVFNSTAELRKSLIENKTGKRQIQDKWICFLFYNEKLYAFEEMCPHQQKSLLGAQCINGDIVCPFHQYKFNLQTGCGHDLSLQTYPIKKESDRYYIQLF